MEPAVTVIGGNIAGLSAAYHLARRGFAVTVYEAGIWNKPCGGAISFDFVEYLKHTLGILPAGSDFTLPGLRLAFRHGPPFDLDGFFAVTHRRQLQNQMIERLEKEPNIRIVFKRVSLEDRDLLTPQTILASGFSGLTRRVLGRNWHRLAKGRALRAEGRIQPGRHPDCHLMAFDSRISGYGWVFIGENGYVNIGAGGMAGRERIRRWYAQFLAELPARHGYEIRPGTTEPAAWKIPVSCRNWNHPVCFSKGGVEFIGAGDVLGLPHPVIGAGIEPAWMSGWLLGRCADPRTGHIDTERYVRILEKNLRLTCRRPMDRALTRILQSRLLPFKDAFGCLGARILARYRVRMVRRHPWFAPISDR